jgi:hypothetical protein
MDANGSVISTASTGNGGSLSFASLVPGVYRLSSANGCALFANGVDARNGFTIVAGGTVEVVAFGCAAPAPAPNVPTRPDPNPGSIGGGVGTGSDAGGSIGDVSGGTVGSSSLGTPGFHTRNLKANPLASVSTLPATGEGRDSLSLPMMALLLALAALAAALGTKIAPLRTRPHC